jgi:septal ring factor EnvC (AmiA/AmiB activator)
VTSIATTYEDGTCPSCKLANVQVLGCTDCARPRNRHVPRAHATWWATLVLVGACLVSLLLSGASLQERSRDRELARREAKLAGIRAEQQALRTSIKSTRSTSKERKRRADSLAKRAPRLKEQLAGAERDNSNLRSQRDRLQSALAAGVLAPGTTL